MSRRLLPPKIPKTEVFAGWDPPLGTYFVQVYAPGAGDDPDPGVLVWEGGEFNALPTLPALLPLLAWHAEVTPQIQLLLAADRVVNHGLAGCEDQAAALVAEVQEMYPAPNKALAYLLARYPNPRR